YQNLFSHRKGAMGPPSIQNLPNESELLSGVDYRLELHCLCVSFAPGPSVDQPPHLSLYEPQLMFHMLLFDPQIFSHFLFSARFIHLMQPCLQSRLSVLQRLVRERTPPRGGIERRIIRGRIARQRPPRFTPNIISCVAQ